MNKIYSGWQNFYLCQYLVYLIKVFLMSLKLFWNSICLDFILLFIITHPLIFHLHKCKWICILQFFLFIRKKKIIIKVFHKFYLRESRIFKFMYITFLLKFLCKLNCLKNYYLIKDEYIFSLIKKSSKFSKHSYLSHSTSYYLINKLIL